MEVIQLNGVIGMAVVFITISVLTYALLKQIKNTKNLDRSVFNSWG